MRLCEAHRLRGVDGVADTDCIGCAVEERDKVHHETTGALARYRIQAGNERDIAAQQVEARRHTEGKAREAIESLEGARAALKWVDNHRHRNDPHDMSHAKLALDYVLGALELLREA